MRILKENIFIIILAAFLLQGCSGPMVNVSQKQDYEGMLGRSFVLQSDCYVFYFEDEKSGVPLIAPKRKFPIQTLSDCIGKYLYGRIVLGEIKAGQKFKVDSVFRQKIFSSVSPVQYYVYISVENGGRWKELDAILLMDDPFNPTAFDSDVSVR